MLLDSCGDENRESPATNHPTPSTSPSIATYKRLSRSAQTRPPIRSICTERPSSAPTKFWFFKKDAALRQ